MSNLLICQICQSVKIILPVNEEVEEHLWQIVLGVLQLLPEVEGAQRELALIGEIKLSARRGCWDRRACVGIRNHLSRRC